MSQGEPDKPGTGTGLGKAGTRPETGKAEILIAERVITCTDGIPSSGRTRVFFRKAAASPAMRLSMAANSHGIVGTDWNWSGLTEIGRGCWDCPGPASKPFNHHAERVY